MTKEELYSKGVRADSEQGNHYFVCETCGQEWRSKLWNNYSCACGSQAEYHYIEHIEETVNPAKDKPKVKLEICTDDPVLKQARTEAKAKVTKLQRHLFQCSSCSKTTIQHDYVQSLKCACGDLMVIKYTYIGNREYYAYGPTVGQQIEPGNLIKQVRKSLRLSQVELAKELDCNQQFISGMESGSKPVPQYIIDKLTQLYFI